MARRATPLGQRDPAGLVRRQRRLGPLQRHDVLVLHPTASTPAADGSGLSYDGNIVTGWTSMARTEAHARNLVGELKEQDAPSSR